MAPQNNEGIAEPIESRPLQPVDAYELGGLIQYLKHAGNSQYPIFDKRNDKLYILDILAEINRELEQLELETDIQSDVSDMLSRLKNKYPRPEESDEYFIEIDEEDGQNLQQAASSWDTILMESLRQEKYVPISDTGLLDISKAMDNPEALFDDQDVWDGLNQETQDSIVESCRALVFDCPTSSVFMALRAVEDRLRDWYRVETERDIEDRTLGQVLSELDDTYNSNDRPAILSHLDYLTERRNQVVHPDRSANRQEAESTIIMVRETMYDIHEQLSS